MEDLSEGTMTSKLDLPLHGAAVEFVRQNRGALCDVISSKFNCVAVIDGVDFDNESNLQLQRKSTSEDQPRFAAVLRSGVQVSVWKADLTGFPVDAVVNAANTQLQHVGGLAYALVKAGGLEIEKESDAHIRKHGELKTGEAIVTSSGSLPCKCIIHAVGPKLPSYPTKAEASRAEQQLKQTITSILDKVKRHNLQTVAIPAISSGIFNYPLPECANTIVSTVKDYYKYSSHGHLPKEVFLVNHDDPTVNEMTRACHLILADQKPMTFSQAAASKGKADVKTSTNSLQIGKVLLKLKKGSIEEEKTDVIVNTASKDRDLDVGVVSKALLQKAGPGLQREISSAPPSGPVIITKAHNLGSKMVFHTFCTWRKNANAQKILFDSVSECLFLAVAKKHKSIAFPAIGTGSLGFDKREVAQIITTAVAEFAQKAPAALEVSIVIFPSDEGTFKAFEEEMRNLKRKMLQPGFEIAFDSRENFPGTKPQSPQISLSGASDEVTREAERWLQNLLYKTFNTSCIQNNFIVHFGQQEYQELSRLNVSIEERFENGRASIIVKGDSHEDAAVARLQVEAILCKVQKEFVKDQEREIFKLLLKNVPFERKTLHQSDPESQNKVSFNKNLWISKVEKVVNPALEMLFELKKQQLKCFTSHRMFQCLPAQFLDTVSRVGFHAELAPPEDPVLGEGIYFASTVDKAMKMWEFQNEEYIYFVEAEVLLGNSTSGKKDLILPPVVTNDPRTRYDSVSRGPDVTAIFSGYQALPKLIITCKRLI